MILHKSLYLLLAVQVLHVSAYIEEFLEKKVGDSFKVNCTYNEPNATLRFSTEDNLHEKLPIPKNYTTINSTNIEMEFINAKIQQKLLYCELANGTTIKKIDVRVDDKPKNITNFKCIFYNMESMQCTFDVDGSAPLNIRNTMNISYNTSSKEDRQCRLTVISRNGNRTTRSCFFNKNDGYSSYVEKFDFTIVSENKFGKKIETYENVIPKENCKMGPLNAIEVRKISNNSVELKWIASKGSKYHLSSVISEIEIKSQCDNTFKKEPKIVTMDPLQNILHILQNLTYYTRYEVRVRMQSKDTFDNKNISREEMWSEWQYANFTTNEIAPTKSPGLAGYSFENGDLYVYWQEISKCDQNAKHFTYIVQSDLSQLPHESTRKFNYKIKNIGNEVNFNLWSKNDVGRSPKESTLIVPDSSKRENAIPFIHKYYDEASANYTVKWGEPKNSEHIKSYSVFWCKPGHQCSEPCQDLFGFTEVPHNQTFYNLPSQKDPNLNFAVAVNYLDHSSRMEWRSCFANRDGTSLEVNFDPKTSPYQIDLTVFQKCFEDRQVNYTVSYSNPKTQKTYPPKTFKGNKFTIEGLEPNTDYDIKISSTSKTGITIHGAYKRIKTERTYDANERFIETAAVSSAVILVLFTILLFSTKTYFDLKKKKDIKIIVIPGLEDIFQPSSEDSSWEILIYFVKNFRQFYCNRIVENNYSDLSKSNEEDLYPISKVNEDIKSVISDSQYFSDTSSGDIIRDSDNNQSSKDDVLNQFSSSQVDLEENVYEFLKNGISKTSNSNQTSYVSQKELESKNELITSGMDTETLPNNFDVDINKLVDSFVNIIEDNGNHEVSNMLQTNQSNSLNNQTDNKAEHRTITRLQDHLTPLVRDTLKSNSQNIQSNIDTEVEKSGYVPVSDLNFQFVEEIRKNCVSNSDYIKIGS